MSPALQFRFNCTVGRALIGLFVFLTLTKGTRADAVLDLTDMAGPAIHELRADPAIAFVSGAGYRGTTVAAPIEISGAVGVTAVQFDLVFDPSLFLPLSASAGPALAGHFVVSNAITNNTFRVLIFSPTNGPISNGVVATVAITISSSASFGLYPVAVQNVILANAQGQPVTASASSGGMIAVNSGVPPHLDTLQRAISGDISFLLSGAAGQSYILQSSTDLRSWTSFSTNTVANGTLQVIDSSARALPWRFYRALEGF